MVRAIDKRLLVCPGIPSQLSADRATIDEFRWYSQVVQVVLKRADWWRRFILVKQGHTEDVILALHAVAVRPLPGRSFLDWLQFTIMILRQRISQTSQQFVEIH